MSSGQIEILTVRVPDELKIFLTKSQGKEDERNEPGERMTSRKDC